MNWTAEQDLHIRENRGLMSASALAVHHRTTRNAVIGRWHRLRLPKLTRATAADLPKKERVYRPRAIPVAPVVCLPPPMLIEPLNIPFRDLMPKHCREIVGSEGIGQSLSCGHPIAKESYCRWHYSQNYFRPRR